MNIGGGICPHNAIKIIELFSLKGSHETIE
jgi:hypothetical protein